ncbi:MAG: squalene/phytoene synthase family protein [Brachymonas sp.]|nr:squalene/phytoene synthase family protein [Brachymonas sp.]
MGSKVSVANDRSQAAGLYAFARLMDDLVDEPMQGSEEERWMAFEIHRQAFLLGGKSCARSSQVGEMLRSQGVSQSVLASFLDALEDDAGPRHLQSLEKVLEFAYGVAGTVGQMMRPLIGAPGTAERFAVALGMAMQLTNIARDVLEDAQRGRCYLPAEWLPPNWCMQSMLQGDVQARQQAFVAVQQILVEAKSWYALAETGFATFPSPTAVRFAWR